MTKQIGPEQEQVLQDLGTAKSKLQRARRREEEAMREVHGLIGKGFESNISGIKLAEASGLSLPRVYQVRDEIRGLKRLGRNPETQESVQEAEANIDQAEETQV